MDHFLELEALPSATLLLISISRPVKIRWLCLSLSVSFRTSVSRYSTLLGGSRWHSIDSCGFLLISVSCFFIRLDPLYIRYVS